MLLLWLQLKVDEAKEIVTDQWKDLEEAEAEEEAFEDSDQDENYQTVMVVLVKSNKLVVIFDTCIVNQIYTIITPVSDCSA